MVHRREQRLVQQLVPEPAVEALDEAGIAPSVDSLGDSYDKALAETISGVFKAEIIHRRGPWRSFETVEYATLEWVDWFSNRRLLEPIGNIPPAEAEATLLRHAGGARHGGVTQTKQPPAIPVRFPDIGFGRFALNEHSFHHAANKHVVTRMSGLSAVINPGP